MVQFAQLLVGGFWVGAVAVVSWGIGLLMGLAIAKLARMTPAKHADVDELLKRERQTAAVRPAAAAVAAPGASSQA